MNYITVIMNYTYYELHIPIHYMFCYDGSIISREIAEEYSDGVWETLKLDEPIS